MHARFVTIGIVLLTIHITAVTLGGCGAKLFPKCTDPGEQCACTGREVYPDPCAARQRDAGTDAVTK